jgi:hypothetical protein
MRKVIILAVLSACASESDSKESNLAETCDFEGHEYCATYTEIDGDCGPLDSEKIDTRTRNMPTTWDCDSDVSYTSDCTVGVETRCSRIDGVRRDVAYSLSQDGLTWTGTLEVTLQSPKVSCHGRYRVKLADAFVRICN